MLQVQAGWAHDKRLPIGAASVGVASLTIGGHYWLWVGVPTCGGGHFASAEHIVCSVCLLFCGGNRRKGIHGRWQVALLTCGNGFVSLPAMSGIGYEL